MSSAAAEINQNQQTPPPAKMPSSVPYIVGNEAAERFSFYGMKAILMVYMTQSLMINPAQASSYGHYFNAAVYLFPFFGAMLADIFWGKFKVIFYLSLVYCVGHLILAIPSGCIGLSPRSMLFAGLFFIAVGAGGIKSCVSAIVGDQFNQSNQSLLNKVFGWFYLSINIGSFFSMILMPYLFVEFGPHVAFGVPGILMAIATLILWIGRKKYVLIPPSGFGFFKEITSSAGIKCIGKIALIYSFLILFWAMYDQNCYRWVAQAQQMNTQIFSSFSWMPASIRNYTFLPAQIQAVNPLLVLIFIPLFSYILYPLVNRFCDFTMVRKMKWGLILAIIASIFPYWFEVNIIAGIKLNLAWQILAYVFLTAAEVMISVSALELSYTQAPKTMKSLIMSFYTLPISLGNIFAGEINHLCDQYHSFLPGSSYYMFFAVLLILNTILFFIVSHNYKEHTILQD